MTTTRNLIRRLTTKLDLLHCQINVPYQSALINEALDYLAQPEPEGLTDEELLAALSRGVASFPPIHPEAKALSAVEYDLELEIRKARAVIAADRARWGRPVIEPVPVSERPWERERWCDSNGWCWGFDADDTDPFWEFDHPEASSCWTHVLPHYALPVPTTTQEDN